MKRKIHDGPFRFAARRPLTRGPRPGLCLLLTLLSGPVAPRAGEERFSIGELYDRGVDVLEQHLPESVRDQYQFIRSSDWMPFWESIQNALASQDLEEMDRLLPYVAQGVDLLRTLPGGEPYADWLQQRLDYFQVADEAVKTVPRPVPVPPPPPPPVQRQRVVVPPRPPPPPPPPPPVSKRRQEVVSDRGTWERKMARRPAPRNADAVIPGLKKVFREEGVPEQLVWLAEVESSLNPKARSPVGAVGLFQFMPATAQRFGVSTRPVDQRTDPGKSARAAAQYLRVLHKQFNSWPLALAAYNAGEGRVGRLLKQSGGNTFESIEGSIPMETRMYVPKILALISVREGVDGATLPAPKA